MLGLGDTIKETRADHIIKTLPGPMGGGWNQRENTLSVEKEYLCVCTSL